ncbi:hypothetical protein FRC02_005685 [Tulasnella sp. 418]|nr:hypothetical protein FRC02_005685 [Tulasnella sp. 418]
MSLATTNEDRLQTSKGQDAEEQVYSYMKLCNRPYGAADVSANLLNSVTKANAQKILHGLADKGLIIEKVYGKTSYFVTRQDTREPKDTISKEKLEMEINDLSSEQSRLSMILKSLSDELNAVRACRKTDQVTLENCGMQKQCGALIAALTPLRAQVNWVSEDDVQRIQHNRNYWLGEQSGRRKVFDMYGPHDFLSLVTLY